MFSKPSVNINTHSLEDNKPHMIYKDKDSIKTIEHDHIHIKRLFKPNKEFYQWIKDNRIQLIPRDVKKNKILDNNGYYYDLKYDVPHTNIKTLLFIYSFFCNCSHGNKYCSTFNQNGLDYQRTIIPSRWSIFYITKKTKSTICGYITKYENTWHNIHIYGPFTDDPRYIKHIKKSM